MLACMIDCRVLVVEDDQDTREALTALLESEGYEAQGAGDGQEALAMLERGEFKPDVIVLDLYMPAMDGQQFRAALKANPHFAHVPTILCTGTTPLAHTTRDAFATLEKPLDIDALLEIVGRGCAARKKDRAPAA